MAASPAHPAAVAHGALIEFKGKLGKVINDIEELFPHLAHDSEEVATVATDVSQVAAEAGEATGHFQ